MRRRRKILTRVSSSQQSEPRLRCTLDSLLEGVQIIGFDWRYLYVNSAAARHGRRRPEELLGRTIMDEYPGIERTQVFEILRGCMADRTQRREEIEFVYPDGSRGFFELSIQPAPEGLIILSNEITERRRTQNELAETAALLARAQELASIGTYEINFDPALPWSSQTLRIVGPQTGGKEMTPDEYISRVVHPSDRQHVSQLLENAFKHKVRYEAEYRLVRDDRAIRHVHSVAEPLPGPGGQILKYVGAIQDVTERRFLEREILRISDHEKSRIGQDLHDGLCQELAGIEFRLLELKFAAQRRSKHCAAELDKIARLIRDAISETRTIARGLSPVKIGADGLMKALQELVDTVGKNFKISCSLNCQAPVAIHDNVVATHLYRIAQESIQNAIRHGGAKRIVIDLFRQNERVVLGIKDDGAGFGSRRKNHGMGLRIMQYRASIIHGSLVVQHPSTGGAEVICSLDAPIARRRSPRAEKHPAKNLFQRI